VKNPPNIEMGSQAPGELLTREHVNLFARRMFGSIPISMFGGFFTRVCATGLSVTASCFDRRISTCHDVRA
jgi:hypothetical protein